MLDYTRKVGETAVIKKIIDFLNEQEDVVKRIEEQIKRKEDNAI